MIDTAVILSQILGVMAGIYFSSRILKNDSLLVIVSFVGLVLAWPFATAFLGDLMPIDGWMLFLSWVEALALGFGYTVLIVFSVREVYCFVAPKKGEKGKKK